MVTLLHPEEPELLDCEVCRSEISANSGVNIKSADFVYYFCGVQCYREWKKRNASRTPPLKG